MADCRVVYRRLSSWMGWKKRVDIGEKCHQHADGNHPRLTTCPPNHSTMAVASIPRNSMVGRKMNDSDMALM